MIDPGTRRGPTWRTAARLAVCAGVLSLMASSALAARPQGFRVIVNPRNPLKELDRGFVADVFTKRITRWPGGESIAPLDQPLDSPVRQAFTETVFGRPVEAVHNAWMQAIFAGNGVPPPTLDSDAAVVRYVTDHAGAVGYVSPSARLSGVRVVRVK